VTPAWDGQWVADHVGIELRGTPAGGLERFVGLALRDNHRRAHLLVSHCLGKHIPADPRAVYRVGRRLGETVREVLEGAEPLVLGYAETATGLGHAVADELDAAYLHSTRRAVPGVSPAGGFEEEHSHASSHLLLPEDPELLARSGPLVLVDDELSTGRTVVNTIRALQASRPRELYVVACLLDVRDEPSRAAMAAAADQLDTRIVLAASCRGRIRLPVDVIARAERVIAAHPPAPRRPTGRRGEVLAGPAGWPVGVRDGGRHGYRAADRRPAERAARAVAAGLVDQLVGERVLVLGCEELMYAPTLIAVALADGARPGQIVRFSSTTRSPVFAVDDPGYAVRTALTFPAHDNPADGAGVRYAYNVAPAAGAPPYTDIVLVLDDVADTPALWGADGLVEQLAGVCARVHVLVLPSYRPAER
jgi:adenine/guanine phosphoribosyltransferase-like PRPP-binding protein